VRDRPLLQGQVRAVVRASRRHSAPGSSECGTWVTNWPAAGGHWWMSPRATSLAAKSFGPLRLSPLDVHTRRGAGRRGWGWRGTLASEAPGRSASHGRSTAQPPPGRRRSTRMTAGRFKKHRAASPEVA
jgi:hypothetical protein